MDRLARTNRAYEGVVLGALGRLLPIRGYDELARSDEVRIAKDLLEVEVFVARSLGGDHFRGERDTCMAQSMLMRFVI